jgi:hypothetical protein
VPVEDAQRRRQQARVAVAEVGAHLAQGAQVARVRALGRVVVHGDVCRAVSVEPQEDRERRGVRGQRRPQRQLEALAPVDHLG